MVLVLALLITTLCGVQSASIPSNSLDTMLASKSDKLEKRDAPNLHKIRRGVMDDMKKLLDSQLAALFESAVQRKAGTPRKPNTKSRQSLRKGDITPNFDSVIRESLNSQELQDSGLEDSQNSEIIKVITDDSLQDPEDEVLRAAVDQLLQEDENRTEENIDNIDDIQLIDDNSAKMNNEDISDENALPGETSLPFDKNIPKSNVKKGSSHVIIEHASKTNTSDDDIKNTENVLDLDGILKSALNKYTGSSQEDGNVESIDSDDRDFVTRDIYSDESKLKEPRMSNNSQTRLRNDDSAQINEHTLNTENYTVSSNNDSREIETDSKSTNKHFNSKTKHHKHIHQHSRNIKGRQPINYKVSSEKNINNRHGLSSSTKELNKANNATKELKLDNNEDTAREHEERKHAQIKTTKRNNSSNKNQSKQRDNKNQDKHKHYNNHKIHDHGAKANHDIIVKLISDSDGSPETGLDTIHDKKVNNEKHNLMLSSDFKTRRSNFDETHSNSDSNDLSTSREKSINDVNASQDDTEHEIHLAKTKDSNSNEDKNDVNERDNVNKKDESGSIEDDLIVKRSETKESHKINTVKPATKDIDKPTAVAAKGRNGRHGNVQEDIFIEKDNHNNGKKNKLTRAIESTGGENKTGENIEHILTSDKKSTKNDETHKCKHEIDDADLIHDLLQNQDTKKSYSLSLTLSTK